jgi:hypothetical protein
VAPTTRGAKEWTLLCRGGAGNPLHNLLLNARRKKTVAEHAISPVVTQMEERKNDLPDGTCFVVIIQVSVKYSGES